MQNRHSLALRLPKQGGRPIGAWVLLFAVTLTAVRPSTPVADTSANPVESGFIYIYEVPEKYTLSQLQTPLDQSRDSELWTQTCGFTCRFALLWTPACLRI